MTAVRISTASGRVRVIAEARDDVHVDGDATVDSRDETTTVVTASGRVVVRVPEGTDVVVGTDSGRVEVHGRAGGIAATTTSGRIEVDEGTNVDARSESGRIVVGRATGVCRIRGNTGRVEIGASAGADASTNSGRIVLRDVDGPVRAHCISGRIEIGMAAAHDVDAETVSGRITVTMPDGTTVHRLQGKDDDSPPPADSDCSVRATSISGRIRVQP